MRLLLRLGMQLAAIAAASVGGGGSAPDAGALEFNDTENSGLIVLFLDD